MVSSLSLLNVHLSLSEITSKDKLCRGISVIFFANLLQLPPVKGNQQFITLRVSKKSREYATLSVSGFHLNMKN